MSRHSFRLAPLFATALVLQLCLCASPARAQRRVPARPAPPSPQTLLGFAPGDDKTIADWTQIRNYFARLDAASERVKVETIGLTTLGRPLFVAYISAPENIRNLARYQEMQRRLADPRTVRNGTERD